MKEPPASPSQPMGKSLPWLIGGVVAGVGGLVLVGWVLDRPELSRLFLESTQMKTNGAIGFLFIGIALLLLQWPGTWRRRAARFCALVVGGIGLCTLVEYAGGWNFGIDEFLFRDTDPRSISMFPGRMSPTAAVACLMTAWALWLMTRAIWTVRLSWILACLGSAIMAIGLVALLCHLAEFRTGYRLWDLAAMPIHSAMLYVLLGGVVLNHAWRKAGMRWWITRRLTLMFSCVLALLVAVTTYSIRSTKYLVEAAAWVKHTREVIGKIAELRNSLNESQSGVRGYLLTRDETFLPLFDNDIVEARKLLAELHELCGRTSNDEVQQARLALLERLLPERVNASQQVVEQRRTHEEDTPEQLNAVRVEKALMDQIRICLGDMDKAENIMIGRREARMDVMAGRTFSILPAGLLLSMVLLGAGMLRLNGEIAERQRGTEALRDAVQKLRLHFEQTPMAVIEWDLDFRVARWNPAARLMFGYSSEEAIGQHASFILPEEARPHVDQIWQDLTARRGGERSSNQNVRKDGMTIFCEWYNTALIDEQGAFAGVASLVQDITERRQALQLLAWEKSALELIGSEATLPEVLDGLMRGLEQQTSGALYSVLLLDDKGKRLRFGAAPSLPHAYNQRLDGIAIGPAVGSCGTAVFLNRQVIVSDIGSDPLWDDFRRLALEHNLHACWSTPIHGDKDKILGTFAVYYHQPRSPIASELELMTRAANVTRIAIERKKAERDIRNLRASLDEHAIVAITDAVGRITYVNDKFCKIAKYTQQELLGQDHRIINSGYHSKAFFKDLWQTIISGRTWKGEIRNRAKDGSIYWVDTTIVPFLGQDGKPSQFVSIRNDVTERKQAEDEIRQLNISLDQRVCERTEQLEAAIKELDAFSYSVSHDLRAPLRAVDGFSRILVNDYAARLDEEGLRVLGVIHSETQRMGQLIDDLLSFSRLGRQQIAHEQIPMGELAQAVFDELAAQLPGRPLRLDLHPIPSAHGSQTMIRQVWVNLISNALKFTQGRELGEIEIGAQEDEDGVTVYYIKDNGAGFDMRYVNKLFGVFQRLHSQQEFPGTGVGLALVQRIIQRHGGRIWAEAEVDRGATFFFSLAKSS